MYTYPIYRPPSEASSLILQLTLGCSYNKCLFCYSFKSKPFHTRTLEDITDHVKKAKQAYPNPRKIFLADANVMCVKTQNILKYLALIKEYFPDVGRISSYAGPLDILRKTDDELKQLYDAGLTMIYMGVESGSAEVLQFVKKGVTPEEMIVAGKKIKQTGFTLSCMIISGLGGKRMTETHAVESGRVISAINPDFFSLLTLIVENESPMKKFIHQGVFSLLSPPEVMLELRMMVENLALENCVFRANHASNYYSFRGILNQDKARIIEDINNALKSDVFKPESWRAQ